MAIATVFGQHADPRLAAGAREAGGAEQEGSEQPPIGPHEYQDQEPPFWMDYVSDTGDGWDATYTVAYHLAQDELVLRVGEREAERPEAIRTERGRILVFGGDEVYPTASPEEYDRRLVLPYQHAFPGPPSPGLLQDAPDVFAIPGNHDWYDSLVAFTRLFCSGHSFAGWNARQRQSYFALRLPMGWWLIATDLQLGSEIDRRQHAFFENVEKSIGPEERIILCHSEPTWIYERTYPDEYAYRSIRDLEALFGDRIKVFLAGDYHHYVRHENGAGVQKIVAGGGGAFLHLTNGPDERELDGDTDRGRFRCRQRYPSWWLSWWLCWTNLFLFPVRNWLFGFATAPAYAVTASALSSPQDGPSSPGELLAEVMQRVALEPFSLFWVVTLVLGVVFFTDTSRLWYRWTAGTLHAFGHIAAAVLLGEAVSRWLDAQLAANSPGLVVWQPPLVLLGTALAGYVVGPLVLALYLTLSLNVFRRHRNDASSALRNSNYKNFLRLRIGTSGDLTIYPVGIGRVATWFRRPKEETPSRLEPADGTPPFLIEEPIVIRAAGHERHD